MPNCPMPTRASPILKQKTKFPKLGKLKKYGAFLEKSGDMKLSARRMLFYESIY